MIVKTGVRAGHNFSSSQASKATVLDPERIWEIDALRGLAMGEMLAVHLIKSWIRLLNPSLALAMLQAWMQQKALVEGALFGVFITGAVWLSSAAYRSGSPEQRPAPETGLAASLLGAAYLTLPALVYWAATAGSGAAGFLALSGMALAIEHQKKAGQYSEAELFRRCLKRGGSLFAWGMAMTAVSLLFSPNTPVLFGILHLFGLSSILIYPFLQMPAWANLTGGVAGIALGELLKGKINHPWLLWLASQRRPLMPIDYHPLLPWFGVILVGVWAGKILFRDGKRRYRVPDWAEKSWVEGLSWLGKNSLAVYLAQEPFVMLGFGLAS